MAIDEIKKLPPNERIKKLKEIEEQHKKEIEQAEELIRESRREITETARRIDIPDDAVTADSVDALLTVEEKQLFETKRFTGRVQDTEEQQQPPPENIEEITDNEPAPKLEDENIVSYDAGIDGMREGPENAYVKQEDAMENAYESSSRPDEGLVYERQKEDEERRKQVYEQ